MQSIIVLTHKRRFETCPRRENGFFFCFRSMLHCRGLVGTSNRTDLLLRWLETSVLAHWLAPTGHSFFRSVGWVWFAKNKVNNKHLSDAVTAPVSKTQYCSGSVSMQWNAHCYPQFKWYNTASCLHDGSTKMQAKTITDRNELMQGPK